MNPVKSNTYIDSSREIYNIDPKFKIGDIVRISKYRNIELFAKVYAPNCSEEIFMIKKVKNTVPWTNVINDLNREKIVGTFYKNKLQKTKPKEFRIEKRNLNTDFTLGGCLFGGVKLTKNNDPDKYSYSGYDIGSNTCGQYSLPYGSVGNNVIMSLSVHIDNKGKDILILVKGPTQGLNHTLAAETQYSINFTRPGIKSC